MEVRVFNFIVVNNCQTCRDYFSVQVEFNFACEANICMY